MDIHEYQAKEILAREYTPARGYPALRISAPETVPAR